MAGLYVPTRGEINALTYWKSAYFNGGAWKETGASDRVEYLKRLLNELNTERNGVPYRWIGGTEYTYAPAHDGYASVITVDEEHPSIISALHELGHHLFGSDELEACRYSIGVFKAAFPKAFEKLAWNGHMLVKPQ